VKHFLVLAGVALGGALVAGCCAGLKCLANMEFVVHIPRDRAGLEGATVTVCRNGSCGTGTLVWNDASDPWLPSGGWHEATVVFTGENGGEGSIRITPDGRATLDLKAYVGTDGRDGDLHTLQVVDAAGTTVIDFSRRLTYTHQDGVCAQNCVRGLVEIWPSSANGLTCSSLGRTSGASYVSPVLTLPAGQAQGTTFAVCRNAVCSRAIWPRNVFDGALGAALAGGARSDNTFMFEIYMYDDPAVLADGDAYTLTITDAYQNVVVAVDQAVTYDQSFPDGAACDAFPTRQVTLGP
jgi:hypothetical protein